MAVPASHPQRCRGFTLIEMVVTLVVLAVIGGVVAVGVSHGARAYLSSPDIVATLSKLRLTSERLAREIRTVRRDPSNPGDYHFTSRTVDSMTFSRLESDGSTVTTVTIDGSANPLTLEYDTPAGAQTLTDQVSSFAFSYYQDDGVTAATGNADIAFVEFDLELTDGNGNTYPQRTRVALRNQQ